jgi:hypothetical protein
MTTKIKGFKTKKLIRTIKRSFFNLIVLIQRKRRDTQTTDKPKRLYGTTLMVLKSRGVRVAYHKQKKILGTKHLRILNNYQNDFCKKCVLYRRHDFRKVYSEMSFWS